MTKWKPVSQERYDEMLNILPPHEFSGGGFLVGEAYSQRPCRIGGCERPTYKAFRLIDGQAYEAIEPLTAPEFRAIGWADVLTNVVEAEPRVL